MSSRHLSTQALSRLLSWLDADPERAALVYRGLQTRLTRLFLYRGCPEAEELAAEVMDRVTAKVGEIAESYQGDPASFFYGVARNVFYEYLRRQARLGAARAGPPPVPDASARTERAHHCLDRCLEQELSAEERELILEYYRSERRPKIEDRRRLAREERVSAPALRKRTQRIRSRLKECVGRCLDTAEA